jgi:hypothetical protein
VLKNQGNGTRATAVPVFGRTQLSRRSLRCGQLVHESATRRCVGPDRYRLAARSAIVGRPGERRTGTLILAVASAAASSVGRAPDRTLAYLPGGARR